MRAGQAHGIRILRVSGYLDPDIVWPVVCTCVPLAFISGVFTIDPENLSHTRRGGDMVKHGIPYTTGTPGVPTNVRL